MNSADLEAAGRAVTAAAGPGPTHASATGDGWGASHVLAHLIAANRNAAELAARILAGADSGSFTNRGALEGTYLNAIVQAAASPAGVLEEFERSTRELLDTCAPLDAQALATPIDAVLWDAGAVVFEQTVPLEQLLTIVRGHLEGHAAQLQELSSRT